MTQLDSLFFLLSIAALPIAAVLTAHYALWALDRDLEKAPPVQRRGSSPR